MVLVAAQRVNLDGVIDTGRLTVGPFRLDPAVRRLRVSLARRTTLTPLVWPDDTGRLAVRLTLREADGTIHTYAGQCSGGVRTNRRGDEADWYVLRVAPTVQFVRSGDVTAVQTIVNRTASCDARVELVLLRGTVQTAVTVEAA